MGVPKRHHYVPRCLLKRFTDDDGWLHVFSEHDRRVRQSRVDGSFVRKHLYSEVKADGSKDPKVEHDLAWLDGEIEAVLAKLERAAEVAQEPRLNDYELLLWRYFMVVQWRRVPDLHRTVATDAEAEDSLREILDEAERHFPDRRDEIDQLRSPSEVGRTIRNARIANVAEVSPRVMEAMQSRGLAILIIRPPNKSLVIGSRPVVQLNFKNGLQLMDEATEMWLPISSKIAVGVGPRSRRETIYFLDDHAAIRHLNLCIARQSSDFASCSTALTHSIAHAR